MGRSEMKIKTLDTLISTAGGMQGDQDVPSPSPLLLLTQLTLEKSDASALLWATDSHGLPLGRKSVSSAAPPIILSILKHPSPHPPSKAWSSISHTTLEWSLGLLRSSTKRFWFCVIPPLLYTF